MREGLIVDTRSGAWFGHAINEIEEESCDGPFGLAAVARGWTTNVLFERLNICACRGPTTSVLVQTIKASHPSGWLAVFVPRRNAGSEALGIKSTYRWHRLYRHEELQGPVMRHHAL